MIMIIIAMILSLIGIFIYKKDYIIRHKRQLLSILVVGMTLGSSIFIINNYNPPVSAANNTPTVSDVSPADEEVDVSSAPTISITIHDTDDSQPHANWDKYKGNNLNTGVVTDCDFTPINNTLLWTANVTGDFDEFGGPCVHDGIVYCPSKDYDGDDSSYDGYSNLTALYLNNGTKIWSFSFYDEGSKYGTDATPLYHNGTIYSAGGEKNGGDSEVYMYAVWASNGTFRWKTECDSINDRHGSALYDEMNDLVIVTAVGDLFAFYPNNGTIKWTDNGYGDTGGLSPALYDGVVYWQNDDIGEVDTFYATYSNNGTRKWSDQIGGWDASPVIGVDEELVYFGTGDRTLGCVIYAKWLNNGTTCWSYQNGYEGMDLYSSPAYYDGYLYAICEDLLVKLNASNQTMDDETREIWNTSITGSGSTYSSLIYANGYLYFGRRNQDKIYCYDASDGTEEWTYGIGEDVFGQPAIADGILLITCDDWNLYAFGDLSQYNTTDEITVTFSSNESGGTWSTYQTNRSCLDGETYKWDFTEANTPGQTYWWNVSINDGTINQTYSYSFTLAEGSWTNTEPTVEMNSPTGAGASINPHMSIRVNDSDGNESTVDWKYDDDSNVNASPLGSHQNTSILNQTAYYNLSGLDYSTQYWVCVWVNDTNSEVELCWSFTTQAEPVGDYNVTVRKGGVDYFTWLGGNTSAYNVTVNIGSFDSASEYVAKWNLSATWDSDDGLWDKYYGDASGNNFSLNTFDVIEIYLEGDGTDTVEMFQNDAINYDADRNVTIYKTDNNKGFNYIGFSR